MAYFMRDVVWCGVVWCGMVWNGMVWWYGMVKAGY